MILKQFRSKLGAVLGILSVTLLLNVVGASAQIPQPTQPISLPTEYRLNGITHIYQGWNNCGPATLTMGLTYFGVPADQYPAAQWLKPNSEDKNVSPWQMTAYVNTQLPGTVQALMRYGGTLDTLRLLIANDFPVIIEAGYDPPGENLGWMGHYLLMSGYNDAAQVFVAQDSYDGPNLPYTYDHVQEYWQHFNYLYIVLYDVSRETELLTLLGDDADEDQNVVNAMAIARAEAVANPEDPFAWFNMGTNFNLLGMYSEAATAYDQSRNVGDGLPWRMMWYQFGPFEAYLEVGRYNDVISLAAANLNDGGGQYVEETYYYAGWARAGLGETQRAIDNFNGAISFNPNFTPAREALSEVTGG